MTTILVTGGSHGLGIPTVALLQQAGHGVRVLSRRSGDYRGDLSTGVGVDAAVDGVDVVVHLATSGRKDIGLTSNLLVAAKSAGVEHIVYMSIVGVDRIDFPYYRDKFANERLVAAFGLPYTILRATQFHSLVARVLAAKLPVRLALPISVQPIDTGEVAERVAELALSDPAGRVADIGGPEVLTFRHMAETWNTTHRSRKPIVSIPLRGKALRGFEAGYHLAALPGYGTRTFVQYAADDAAARVAR